MQTALLDLVEPETAGDPQTGRRWIGRSLTRVKEALLSEKGHRLSHETIRRVLRSEGICPRANAKRLTPRPHPDRDLQFRYIQEQRADFEKMGWPVVSVDTKRKELIGCFAQPGKTWCSEAPSVYMHDFPSDALARAVPYGVYDVANHCGHFYLSTSADTPAFSTDALLWWWQEEGRYLYSDAPELLVLADAGGSNGYRPRSWKGQLQEKLADGYGLTVTVCHYPTGASKWNPIEHCLFSEVSKSFSGVPLTSLELMRELIEETSTESGLRVKATLVEKTYEKGITLSDTEMAALALEKHGMCPQWNYTIRPRNAEVIN